ncbi:hypothetical protein SHM_22080 [Spiroplasma ixodetis]|uniref:Uncharacterized protein n=1 Tax=Spiroplasma ixodetis TaxID=2141 RepID=A0ABN6T5L0_9MOLU|nr:hypothetical protein [Spiroplasma ixodetis]BDT04562.1 hypothetical protein SHM_22080 [Spiroplasma ixodetis]
MHKNYPSHVTKEQFENIKSTLENSKKKTKPRNLDLYEVFCGGFLIICVSLFYKVTNLD